MLEHTSMWQSLSRSLLSHLIIGFTAQLFISLVAHFWFITYTNTLIIFQQNTIW
jgi:hypothetical protein